MTCTECGMRIPSAARVCPYCGTHVISWLEALITLPYTLVMVIIYLVKLVILTPITIVIFILKPIVFIVTLPFKILGKLF